MKNIFLFLLLLTFSLKAQDIELNENSDIFYFDSVVFNSDSTNKARMDIYTIVPYQSLTFIRANDIFGAEYELTIKIENSDGYKIENRTISKFIHEKNYFSTQGGNGEFDYNQTIFYLPEGKYNIDVILLDKTDNKSYKRNRIQTVLDFSRYNFSLSGLMVVSAIEENNGRFIITPHVSDNIGNLSEFFFIFFETYKKNTNLSECDFAYQIADKDNNIVFQSDRIRRTIGDSTQQNYIKVNIPATLNQGSYMIRLYALGVSDNQDFEKTDILASSERSIKFYKVFGSTLISNIVKAIKQLRYIATQSEIDYIESAANQQEKILRFEEFWKAKDPSPNTDRNEAFDDYYSRIDYANLKFKTYAEGWMTDMGMVYIIYGQPVNIDRSGRGMDGRIYERWTYSSKQFIFVDYNGLGDFRLYSPMSVTDKYRYQ